eukprot:7141072-Pyramimonas_sp.AAC.1
MIQDDALHYAARITQQQEPLTTKRAAQAAPDSRPQHTRKDSNNTTTIHSKTVTDNDQRANVDAINEALTYDKRTLHRMTRGQHLRTQALLHRTHIMGVQASTAR